MELGSPDSLAISKQGTTAEPRHWLTGIEKSVLRGLQPAKAMKIKSRFLPLSALRGCDFFVFAQKAMLKRVTDESSLVRRRGNRSKVTTGQKFWVSAAFEVKSLTFSTTYDGHEFAALHVNEL